MLCRKSVKVLTSKWMGFLCLVLLVALFFLYVRCRLTLLSINQVIDYDRNTVGSTEKKSIECYLFIFIITSPGGIGRRKAIRETWLNKKYESKIAWRFVIGIKDLSSTNLRELQTEQDTYTDLLFLRNHLDSYQNLTSKLLKSLVWISYNVNSKFILKADDDTYVRLDILLNDMKKRQKMERIYWGYFRGNSNVKRVGTWAENNWFLSDHYLPYALGGGYILTMDLIDYVSKVSHLLELYKSEDVSLGVWLAPVKINRIHDVRFDTEFKSRGCNNNHVVSHKQSTENMYEKYSQVTYYNRLCKVEHEVFYAFEYNWNVLPSECCKRVPSASLANTL